MDERNGVVFALHTTAVHVSDADAHATKSQCGNFEAASAEYACFHKLFY